MNTEIVKNYLWSIGNLIIFYIFILFVLITVSFFLNAPIAAWQNILALSLSALLPFFFRKFIPGFSFKKSLGISLSFLFIIIISIILSACIYDFSDDGQTYHAHTIEKLINGWNPIKQQIIEHEYINDYSVERYPKLTEYLATAIYKTTNIIESSKASNLILCFAAFFICLTTLLSFSNIPIRGSFIIAFIAAFNPVTVVQMWTFYVDSVLYSLLLIIICTFILILKNKENYWYQLLLFISVILFVNIKFQTIIFLVVIAMFVLAFCYIYYKKYQSLIQDATIIVISSMFFGIFIFGYNPYFSNIKNFGNIFSFNESKNNPQNIFEDCQPPLNFQHENLPKNLFNSVFSASSNKGDSITHRFLNSKLKIPFTVSKDEIKSFRSADIRIGGFGPLFGGIIILSFILLGFKISMFRNKDDVIKIMIFCISILCSVFILPGAWWARFAPQLWLLPIGIVIYLLINNQNRFIKSGSILICVLFLANIFLISIDSSCHALNKTKAYKMQLAKFKNEKEIRVNFRDLALNRLRFKEAGINFKEEQGEQPIPIIGTAFAIGSSASIK